MKTGVLLVNLGTPDSPSVKDVRKYLHQFFSDPLVIDMPWFSRQLLKYLIILPLRSPKSAQLYQSIWTKDGSPLLVHSLALKEKLQESLGDKYQVEIGMRYGNPCIEAALEKLNAAKVNKLIILPLFPQYASSTTGSAIDAVKAALIKTEITNIRFIPPFFNHVMFINAWAEQASAYNIADYDHILFSFHGLPERHILKDAQESCLRENCCDEIDNQNANCYRAQCHETAKLIAIRLNIASTFYAVTFQSRIGRTPWIKPHTDKKITELAKNGAKKILVFAPSFVADCLETLHEISIKYKKLFIESGGEQLDLVESLNSHPAWVSALKQLIEDG